MSGDIEAASRMVRDDFSIPGHSRRIWDKVTYFAGAAIKARFIRAFRILRQWVDGDDVSTICELDNESRMAPQQWQ